MSNVWFGVQLMLWCMVFLYFHSISILALSHENSQETQEVMLLHFLQLKLKFLWRKKLPPKTEEKHACMSSDSHHKNQETDCPVLTTPLSDWEVISGKVRCISSVKNTKHERWWHNDLRIWFNCIFHLILKQVEDLNTDTNPYTWVRIKIHNGFSVYVNYWDRDSAHQSTFLLTSTFIQGNCWQCGHNGMVSLTSCIFIHYNGSINIP